jgi:hypothetical protein
MGFLMTFWPNFRNPPSRWLHIRGLKRPFTNRGLLELLGKFGTVDTDHFWIDSIKSNCIVTVGNFIFN